MNSEKYQFKGDGKCDEQFIDTMRFIESRSREMAYFEEYQRKKHIGTRVVAQTVPRNMRRRAMSHCRTRIPSRIRDRAHSGLTKGIKKAKFHRPRRTGRKSLFRTKTNLAELKRYNKVHANRRILETHCFHAKRMIMKLYCGFRVASESFLKQHRTAYKFSMTHSLVFDKSYYLKVGLRNIEAAKLARVREFCGERKPFADCLKIDDFQVFLIAHPLMQEDIKSLISELGIEKENVFEVDYGTNVLELWGPTSLQTLSRVIRLFGTEQQMQSPDWQLFNKGLEPVQLPPNYQTAWELMVNKTIPISEPFKKVSHEAKTEIDNDLFVRFLTTYKHQNALQFLLAQSRAIEEKLLTESDQQQLSQKELPESQNAVMLIQNSSVTAKLTGKKLSRVLVLVPGSCGNTFLKSIVKNRSKVIGFDELNFVLHNHMIPVFPIDFPESKAFAGHETAVVEARKAKYLSFPDLKKIDYFRNSFAFPFNLRLPSENQIGQKHWFFRLLTRGSLTDNAIVYECQMSDLNSLLDTDTTDGLWADIMNYKPPEASVIFEEKKPNDKAFDNIDQYAHFLRESVVSCREPIGKVLHAHFNYHFGKTAGALLASAGRVSALKAAQDSHFKKKKLAKELRSIWASCKGLVWLRNHDSFAYHLAVLL